jgi:uncharacterized protein YjdB
MLRNPTRALVPALLFLTLAIPSCEAGTSMTSVEPRAAGEPATLEITDFPEALNDGDTVRLSARVLDENGRVLQGVKVVWSSATPSIAAVTPSGQLIGASPGEALLTASAGSLSESRKPTVRATPTRLVIVTGSDQEGAPGEALRDSLVAQVLDRHGKPVPDVFVDFVVTSGGGTASPLVIETDASGLGRTQWTLGTADLPQLLEGRARRPGLTPSLKDSVVVFTARVGSARPTAAKIEIAPAATAMAVGDTLRLTATVRDVNGSVLDGHPVSWGSSNASVVTVGGTGLATAHGAGSARVTARADEVEGSASIAVADPAGPEPGTIVILAAAGSLAVGDTLALTAIARAADGSEIQDPDIRWSSHDPNIATVDTMGMLIGRSIGTALITASAVCCSPDSAPFAVQPTTPAIVADLRATFPSAETISLAWTEVDDGAGAPADYLFRFSATPYGHWGTAVAVSAGSCAGIVRGAEIGRAGACSVAGLDPGTEYGFQVVAFRETASGARVFGPVSAVAVATTEPGDTGGTGTLEVSPTSHTFTQLGQELQLTVIARGPDGQVIDNPQVTWSSSDTEVATVDSRGLVVARSVGTALIVASASCCAESTADVNVVAGPANPHYTNEPAGFVELARNDWSALPGDWGSNRWGLSGPFTTDGRSAEVTIANDATAPVGGASVLRMWAPEGYLNGYAPGRTGYSFGTPRRIFVGWWVKYDEDFIIHPFQIKWHFVTIAPEAANAWLWVDHFHRHEGNVPGNPGVWAPSRLRLRFQGSGWSRDQLQAQNVQPELVEMPYGKWVKLEMYLDLGTPGQPNGVIRLWQDGVLIVELTDLAYPANATGFSNFRHEGTYGGAGHPYPQDQAWYVAQTYISAPGS